MKRILMIGIPIVLVAGLLTAGTIGFRERRHHMAKDFLEYKLDRMSQELNLNASQQATLDRFKQDMEARMEERMKKRAEIHKLVADELSKDNPSLEKITPVIDRQIDEMAQLGHELVTRVDEFYNQLTPEQKKKIGEHILERMEEHGHGHGFED